MKKVFLFLLGCFYALSPTHAQTFEKGAKSINLGIGVGTIGLVGKQSIPPVSASFEIGINDKWSVGGLTAFSSSKLELGDYRGEVWGWTISKIAFAPRASYHFLNTDKADIYVGGALGYNFVTIGWYGSEGEKRWHEGKEPKTKPIILGAYIGGKYYIANNVALFGELGYGLAYLNIGLTLKL